ncbi:hypothetical protein Mucpa_2874 [Mucilaginibacter paludis DSM 18603]|uniref:Uncharacterized protein n=1 Tax=Mucilaginibacter paludis DSM 18603 TaxID=714943 RepID=H1YAE2_9SPHI|nr:hypothetical protein Mucpa_2874 [Mucilaginibacter paludis DSM 18603]
MKTIINYVHFGLSYYKTVPRPLVKANPMVRFLPAGKAKCGAILSPKRTMSNAGHCGALAPEITFIWIYVYLRFLGEPAMFWLCQNGLAPFMLSHSWGDFFKSF